MKKVQVNTPLILEQNGELVRIETGQIIHLPGDVYAEVSAHTTLLDDMSDEPADEPVSEPVFEPQPMPEQTEPTPDEVAPQADDVGGDVVSDETVAAETDDDTPKSTRKRK